VIRQRIEHRSEASPAPSIEMKHGHRHLARDAALAKHLSPDGQVTDVIRCDGE